MSTATLVPSLNRFVKFAVAMVSTRSVICSAVKYLPSSSRSDAWMELGQAVRVSANLMADAFLVAKHAAARPTRLFERLDLFVGHALPLRRSGVSAASILAAVHH